MGQSQSVEERVYKLSKDNQYVQLENLLKQLERSDRRNKIRYVNAVFPNGQTPLIAAASKNALHSAILLLRHGADPSLFPRVAGAASALHAAVERGNAQMCETLVRAGASPFVEDARGFTAVDVACAKQEAKILRQLEGSAPWRGWLQVKVPRFGGLSREWAKRWCVACYRFPYPNAPAARRVVHVVFLIYKDSRSTKPSCRIWLDGATASPTHPSAPIVTSDGVSQLEVVLHRSHEAPAGVHTRGGPGTGYSIFLRPDATPGASSPSLSALAGLINRRGHVAVSGGSQGSAALQPAAQPSGGSASSGLVDPTRPPRPLGAAGSASAASIGASLAPSVAPSASGTPSQGTHNPHFTAYPGAGDAAGQAPSGSGGSYPPYGASASYPPHAPAASQHSWATGPSTAPDPSSESDEALARRMQEEEDRVFANRLASVSGAGADEPDPRPSGGPGASCAPLTGSGGSGGRLPAYPPQGGTGHRPPPSAPAPSAPGAPASAHAWTTQPIADLGGHGTGTAPPGGSSFFPAIDYHGAGGAGAGAYSNAPAVAQAVPAHGLGSSDPGTPPPETHFPPLIDLSSPAQVAAAASVRPHQAARPQPAIGPLGAALVPVPSAEGRARPNTAALAAAAAAATIVRPSATAAAHAAAHAAAIPGFGGPAPAAPPAAATAAASPPSEGSDEDTCVICMSEPATAGFLHGESVHRCCCRECALHLKNSGTRLCPMCREPIQAFIMNVY